jgi:hypothetical protein
VIGEVPLMRELRLAPAPDDHPRVLAVLAYFQG